MKNKLILLAAVAAGSMISSVANAAVVTYLDRASFEAAAQVGGRNIQTETFGGIPLDPYPGSGATYNRTFDGFSITGQRNGNYIGVTNALNTTPNVASAASGFVGQNFFSWQDRDGGVVSISIALNAATTAFGFDWFNTDVTDQYQFTVTSGGVPTTFTGPPFTVGGNSGFFGLVSSTPFSTATITNNFFGGYISPEGLDNLTTNGIGSANPGAVPEPATWAMMLLGFGAIGAAMRRRQQQQQSTSVGFAF